LTASFNIKRGVENLTKDYTSPLPAIMAREGMQNALDAADQMGDKGRVRIRTTETAVGDKKLEIHDNGKGMDESALANKLVEIFSTGKEGEESATGGKGIGSASYIYGGKHFEIESVAIDSTDGKKYRITAGGTPDQFLDPVQGSDWNKVQVPKDTPTGTTIKVTMKDDQSIYHSREMMRKLLNIQEIDLLR
jgi:Molecular chaperone, HSP90 family